MRRRTAFMVVAAIVLLAGSGVRPEQALSKPGLKENSHAFAPGRILVKLEEQAPVGAIESINRKNGARVEEKIPKSRLRVIDLPQDLSVAEAVERYEAYANVEYAEPDYELYPAGGTLTPNDPGYPELYGLNNTGQSGGTFDADIDAPEAWSVTTGSPDTVVAVIDTGMDTSHPDLKDTIWTNPDEVPGNGLDDDNNGYIDDVNGWDFYHDDNTVFDSAADDRHGTHVAGTITADGNNGIGIAGVAWGVKVMPLKYIGPERGYVSDATEALNYAVAEGVKISNNSYGYYDNCGGCYSQALMDAIDKADGAGHLFVAAAMNGGQDKIGDDNDKEPAYYPASHDGPNIISVAASDDEDQLTTFSNYGATSVDLAAPGQSVYSTLPGNSYGYGVGTSMATPHVAGVAALIKSKFPELDHASIKAKILHSVDKKPNLAGKLATGGRLNAIKALGPPTILNPRPAPGIKVRDRTPTISVTVRDSETNLAKDNLKLYVDGRRVAGFSYSRTRDRLTFTPKRKLSYNRHNVRVIARDGQGLTNRRTWSFRVVR